MVKKLVKMVKSRLNESSPECPFQCVGGVGCNCYLGNAQIEVASYKKVLPLAAKPYLTFFLGHPVLNRKSHSVTFYIFLFKKNKFYI